MSARGKIIVVAALWVLSAGAMFGLGFGWLNEQNDLQLKKLQDQTRDQQLLLAEQDSFQKAKRDVEEASKAAHQPAELFSKDVTLVNEIKTLEDVTASLHLDFTLSGLSGTVQRAPKAKTQSELVQLPYTVSVSGSFADVVAFLETLENLPFITQVSAISFSAGSGGKTAASFTASFFVRK